MHVECACHGCGVSLLLHVCERRLLHTAASLGGECGEGSEPSRGDLLGQAGVFEDQQLGEQVVRARQARCLDRTGLDGPQGCACERPG